MVTAKYTKLFETPFLHRRNHLILQISPTFLLVFLRQKASKPLLARKFAPLQAAALRHIWAQVNVESTFSPWRAFSLSKKTVFFKYVSSKDLQERKLKWYNDITENNQRKRTLLDYCLIYCNNLKRRHLQVLKPSSMRKVTLGAVTNCVTCPNLSNPYLEIPGCWKRLFFQPLKMACRLPQGLSLFVCWVLLGILIQEHIFTPHDFIEFCFSNKNKRNAFEYNLKGFYALFYLLILIIHSGIGEGMGVRVFSEMRLSVQKFRMRDSKPWSKDQL